MSEALECRIEITRIAHVVDAFRLLEVVLVNYFLYFLRVRWPHLAFSLDLNVHRCP